MSKPRTKTCRRCQLTQSHKFFYNLEHSSDGKDYYCKFCRNQFTKTWKRDHPADWEVSRLRRNKEQRLNYHHQRNRRRKKAA